MNSPAVRRPAAPPRIEYRHQAADQSLGADLLFAVEFGLEAAPVNARRARVALRPLCGAGLIEVWHATGKVTTGFDGAIRYSADPNYLAGAIELDERECGGLHAAAEQAYRSIVSFQNRSRRCSARFIWRNSSRLIPPTCSMEPTWRS